MLMDAVCKQFGCRAWYLLLVYKIRFLVGLFLERKYIILFTAGNISRKAEHEKFH